MLMVGCQRTSVFLPSFQISSISTAVRSQLNDHFREVSDLKTMPSVILPHAGLPVFDFSTFRKGSLEERKEASHDIVDAFKNFGFVYLLNHGIPQEKIDGLFAWVWAAL